MPPCKLCYIVPNMDPYKENWIHSTQGRYSIKEKMAIEIMRVKSERYLEKIEKG